MKALGSWESLCCRIPIWVERIPISVAFSAAPVPLIPVLVPSQIAGINYNQREREKFGIYSWNNNAVGERLENCAHKMPRIWQFSAETSASSFLSFLTYSCLLFCWIKIYFSITNALIWITDLQSWKQSREAHLYYFFPSFTMAALCRAHHWGHAYWGLVWIWRFAIENISHALLYKSHEL